MKHKTPQSAIAEWGAFVEGRSQYTTAVKMVLLALDIPLPYRVRWGRCGRVKVPIKMRSIILFPSNPYEECDMAFSDLYEIKDHQVMAQQNILNIYHAEKLNPAFDAADVMQSYLDTVLDSVRAIQVSDLDHTLFECQSLADPLDFSTSTVTPSVGLKLPPGLSTFTAATIQFNRLRTDMKNGQKRWVAGNENDVVTNLWDATFLTLLDTLGQALINNWEDNTNPGVPVATYVIIKRVCTVDVEPLPCPSYRLPENDGELVMYSPTSFSARNTIRSQVSRKRLV